MRFAAAILEEPIAWIVRPKVRRSAPLRVLRGARVVNPLYYEDLIPPAVPPYLPAAHPRPDGAALVTSHLLVLEGVGPNPTRTSLRIGAFLRAFRYLSGQSTLSDRRTYSTSWDREPSPWPAAPLIHTGLPVLVAARLVDQAFPLARLGSIDDLPSGGDQTPREILLDALAALHHGDWRRAILYAAIAAESVAAHENRQLYNALRRRKKSPVHRFQRAPTGAGAAATDPVFEMLWKSISNRSRALLHEIPLYLSGRSLLVSDKALYDEVVRLHATRNKLAHGAPLEEGAPRLLALDAHGATEAVRCALRVFGWFRRPEGRWTARTDMVSPT